MIFEFFPMKKWQKIISILKISRLLSFEVKFHKEFEKKNGKWLQQEPAELKVIIYKSGGEPFLWNIIWYLAWLAELKTDQIS